MNNLNLDNLFTSLIHKGWHYDRNATDLGFVKNLKKEMNSLPVKEASIGQDKSLNTEIRSDKICWLEPSECGPITKEYLNYMHVLKDTLNEKFYLGLNEFEGNYARYDRGSFYKAHRDNFKGSNKRVVTIITYLNEEWAPGDGGELRLHTQEEYLDIPPTAGGTMIFMSEEILHEVLMAHKPRQAITGWLLK